MCGLDYRAQRYTYIELIRETIEFTLCRINTCFSAGPARTYTFFFPFGHFFRLCTGPNRPRISGDQRTDRDLKYPQHLHNRAQTNTHRYPQPEHIMSGASPCSSIGRRWYIIVPPPIRSILGEGRVPACSAKLSEMQAASVRAYSICGASDTNRLIILLGSI